MYKQAEGKVLPGAVLIEQFGNAMEKWNYLFIKANLQILRLKRTSSVELLCN